MSKALAIDFSTSNTGYAFRNPLTNEYVVGSIAGGKSKDPLERDDRLFNINKVVK